jgi:hypothetical protein
MLRDSEQIINYSEESQTFPQNYEKNYDPDIIKDQKIFKHMLIVDNHDSQNSIKMNKKSNSKENLGK